MEGRRRGLPALLPKPSGAVFEGGGPAGQAGMPDRRAWPATIAVGLAMRDAWAGRGRQSGTPLEAALGAPGGAEDEFR
jgi:hypothetical protein